MRLKLKELVRERGITLIGLARSLKMYRSNLSAIASGSRGVSLKTLNQISVLLDCGLDELIAEPRPPVFKHKKLEFLLEEIEKKNQDGTDKSWVHRLMLAQIRHFQKQ